MDSLKHSSVTSLIYLSWAIQGNPEINAHKALYRVRHVLSSELFAPVTLLGMPVASALFLREQANLCKRQTTVRRVPEHAQISRNGHPLEIALTIE